MVAAQKLTDEDMTQNEPTTAEKRLELLKEHATEVSSQDTMPEAGRKILTGEFLKMLKAEPGSRTGEDIENVHKMRVSIRRMRSAFRLLRPYYKSKITDEFSDELHKAGKSDTETAKSDVKPAQSTVAGTENQTVTAVPPPQSGEAVSPGDKADQV